MPRILAHPVLSPVKLTAGDPIQPGGWLVSADLPAGVADELFAIGALGPEEEREFPTPDANETVAGPIGPQAGDAGGGASAAGATPDPTSDPAQTPAAPAAAPPAKPAKSGGKPKGAAS